MRTPLATALAVSALLLPACHGRFRHAVENLGEVRLVPETRTGPDVDLARIRMVDADTARTPDEGVTAGSMSLQNSGVAIRQAAALAAGGGDHPQGARRARPERPCA